MLNNYVITSIRSFKQHKYLFGLNVLGFSIGIAAAILVALYAYNELLIDDAQPNAESVYRVYADNRAMGLSKDGAINAEVPMTMAKHSQVEDIMLIVNSYFINAGNYPMPDLVKTRDSNFRLNGFYAATPNIMEFVNLQVITGDLQKTLSEPGLIALSQREAERLFGHTEVVGESLTHQAGTYHVAAVFADLPNNTHFAFDVLTHLPDLSRGPFGAHVYFRLAENTAPDVIAQLMTAERQKRSTRFRQSKFDLIPIKEVHFNTNGEFEMKSGGSYLALKVSIALSLLLVVIAAVNFINLNIAGAAKRAKEIGVRKTLGATRLQLISQFLLEALMLILIAGLFAFFWVELLLPGFNQLVNRELQLNYGSPFALGVMTTILGVGLLSGLYPALFLSSFNAKRVLSGDLSRGTTAIWIRKLTLCLQSGFSIGLVIGVLILYSQMQLVSELDVGYAKQDRLIIRDVPAELIYHNENNALLDELSAIDDVTSVSLSDTNYATSMLMGHNFTWPNGETPGGMSPNIVTGYKAVETLGLKLLAGRDFSRQFSGDWYMEDGSGARTAGLLVTKSMVYQAGYDDLNQVVGMRLTIPRRNLTARVVGVVDDIRLGSITKPVLPSSFILGYIRNATGNIVLNTNPGADSEARRELRAQVFKVVSGQLNRSDINVDWIEQEFAAAHKNETMTLTMMSVFSPLAIFLTTLGVVGLASFSVFRRQREMAMRKVLGASRISIVNLIAREFLVLVGVSVLLAAPITYWLAADWLANFNQRIEQNIWVYIASIMLISAVTWTTVASIAFKTASTRPSKILRYE